MQNRAWVAAWLATAALLPGTAFARGTKLLVVVRSADADSAVLAKQLSLALGKAANESARYEWVDLDVLAGGPDRERAHKEIESARRKARRGHDALLRLEVRGAAQLLREAIATYKENSAFLTDVSELTQALMHLGAILLHANKNQAAKKLLAEAITLAPDLETDPQVFNPPMRRIFDDVRKRVLAKQGSLAITSTPAGALAVVDGRAVGMTPITVHDLHEGRHVVRVIDDGLVSWGALVDVTADAETRANATLATPTTHPDLAGQIGDAYRAASQGGNAAAHVADLGKPLGVDQVLLVRVRRNGNQTVADAALYGVVASVRLVRVTRELPASGRFNRHARNMLEELRPPALAILVGALRVPGGRAELSRNAKRAITEIVGGLDATVSFLSTPLTPPCFNDPACVRDAAANLSADGVLELEIKRGSRLRMRARCFDGHSGENLWSDQLTAPADDLGDAPALRATLLRTVDSVWEVRVKSGGVTPREIDTVKWEPQPSSEEPDVLDAPVPEPAEPTHWGRVLGWTAVGVGTAAAIGGTVLTFERNAVLGDPATSGSDKESALTMGRWALGGAALGAAIAAFGSWLTWDSYQD